MTNSINTGLFLIILLIATFDGFKVISAGFIFLLIVGIIVIHAVFGWFVGEHGVAVVNTVLF